MPFGDTPGLFDTLAQPDLLADPYPYYSWLQENDPVHVDADGTVYLSRYSDAELLKDPMVRDAPMDDSRSATLRSINQALIKAVPPRHTDLRRLGSAAFDRQRLHELEPTLQDEAAGLADRLEERLGQGTADLHGELTLPFTQHCAARVFGIPERDVEMLSALPSRMFAALYPRHTREDVSDADEASETLLRYMDDAVRGGRGFVPGSGFARLVEASSSGASAGGVEDVVRLCWMLWWGSYTSVLAAVDLAALTLLEEPQTGATLHADTRGWVEEALRYRSPHVINSANLTTTSPVVVGDVEVPAHTPVRFLLAAMNRDRHVFDEPHTFRPDRRRSAHHIAFGEGIHTCIGAQLARMETAIVLTTLASRFPELRTAAPPTWRSYTTQRLCRRFPVTTAPS